MAQKPSNSNERADYKIQLTQTHLIELIALTSFGLTYLAKDNSRGRDLLIESHDALVMALSSTDFNTELFEALNLQTLLKLWHEKEEILKDAPAFQEFLKEREEEEEKEDISHSQEEEHDFKN